MDRFTSQDTSSFQRNVVWCDVNLTLGTNGAVPSTFTKYGEGILKIVGDGSGNYVVTFQDGYSAVLGATSGFVIQASYSASGATEIKPSAESVASTTPTITMTCYTAAGAAVQPATGDKLYLSFRLKRTET